MLYTVLIAIITCACSFSAFAVESDTLGNEDEIYETVAETEVIVETDPFVETEEPYPIETEPVTDEYIETTEYYYEETTEEPQPVTEEPVIEETEEPQVTEYVPYEEDILETTISPTQRSTSTVSTKRYETNFIAGVVSWACVIIGILVLLIFIASTKLSGRKHSDDNEIYSGRR